MTNITINAKNATIELTKVFAKNASRFGTPEYMQLQQARADYPNYRVIVAKRSTKARDCFKGLTYDYMEQYMKAHEEKDLLKEFYTLCGKDENGKVVEFAVIATYADVKGWFLNTHPQMDINDKKNIDEILQKARESAHVLSLLQNW